MYFQAKSSSSSSVRLRFGSCPNLAASVLVADVLVSIMADIDMVRLTGGSVFGALRDSPTRNLSSYKKWSDVRRGFGHYVAC